MIKRMIAIMAATLLIGCSPSRQDEKQPPTSEEFKAGETVYVCGCPMMCCKSISLNPDGLCICNMPLKKGIVSRMQDHIVIVTVLGREKIIYLDKGKFSK